MRPGARAAASLAVAVTDAFAGGVSSARAPRRGRSRDDARCLRDDARGECREADERRRRRARRRARRGGAL